MALEPKRVFMSNLLDEHSCDFVIAVSEFNGEGFDRMCRPKRTTIGGQTPSL
jgi:hypothetical protein